MAWGAVVGGIVSAVGELLSIKKQSSMNKKQVKVQREAIALQREALDFSKEQWYDWKKKYDPIFTDMMAHIDDGLTPDYNAIAGDINTSFDTARDVERRQMLRYGIRPQDGAFKHSERDYAIRRSAAHSGIRNRARQEAKGEKFRRLGMIHNTMLGVQSAAEGGVRSSYANLANQTSALGNSYANQAANMYHMYGNAAQGLGQWIGSVDWGKAWQQAKGWFNNSGGGGSGGSGQIGANTDSDMRLKDDIKLIETINGVNFYSWKWNDLAKEIGIDSPEVGVIAQEHQDTGFVHVGPHGYLQVDVAGLLKSKGVQLCHA